MSWLQKFWSDEFGGTAIEYSVVAVLISVAGVAALIVIGPSVAAMFTDAGTPF